MTNKIQTIVVGAGVIGLSIARALGKVGHEVLVLEKHSGIARETSSRNSEVIHAGIYYRKDSLKAKLCVEGKKILKSYIHDRNIPYNICGKLIVATDSRQYQKLIELKTKAEINGVDDLVIIDSKAVNTFYEPEVSCVGAIWSPNTGIFDSHCYMEHLVQEIEENYGNVILECEVHQIEINKFTSLSSSKPSPLSSRFTVETSQGSIECDHLINAAGLWSTFLTKKMIGFPSSLIPRSFFAKGNYFRLEGKSPFRRLIYPLPESGGLGIHATIDLSGSVRFGPDVEWLKESSSLSSSSSSNSGDFHQPYLSTCKKDLSYLHIMRPPTSYEVDDNRAKSFYDSIRKYWPTLKYNSLLPDYSGIRSKLCGPTMNFTNQECGIDCSDFIIQGPNNHRIDGLVNLYGMESPGLTSSLAIGDYVKNILNDK